MLRKILLMAFLAGFVILAATLAGCVGDKETTDTNAEPEGRVIVPDAKWDKADTSEEPTGQNTGGGQTGNNSGSGGPPTNPAYQASVTDVQVYANGAKLDPNLPLEVFNGVQTQIEFLITSTSSELAHYNIASAAPVDIPREGELSGYQARIPYTFTFFSQSWGDWGIMITARNKQGDIYTKNVLVQAAEMPGPTGN